MKRVPKPKKDQEKTISGWTNTVTPKPPNDIALWPHKRIQEHTLDYQLTDEWIFMDFVNWKRKYFLESKIHLLTSCGKKNHEMKLCQQKNVY